MVRTDSKRTALVLLVYAEVASLPRTPAAARACNRGLKRARDLLVHAPARDLAVRGAPITSAEFDTLRAPALEELRARCAVCGLCADVGLPLP